MGNNFNSNYSNQNSNNPFRVKQEPTLSVQKKNLQNRINRAQNQNSTFGKPNKPTKNQKACYFGVKDYSLNHKLSCPARGVICKSCNKKGPFARCCNSTKNVNNGDNESNSTVEENINFITSDSESEFGVLKVSGTSHQHPNPKSRRGNTYPTRNTLYQFPNYSQSKNWM